MSSENCEDATAQMRKVNSVDSVRLLRLRGGLKPAPQLTLDCVVENQKHVASKFSNDAQESDIYWARRKRRSFTLEDFPSLATECDYDTAGFGLDSSFSSRTSTTEHRPDVARADEPNERSPNMMFSLLMGAKRSGYLSILLLATMTLTNFAVDLANAHVFKIDSSLDKPKRRAFTPYKSSDRQDLGLGAAAINSVTRALGPILPFTGGVDLRRTEYWNLESDYWSESVSFWCSRVSNFVGWKMLSSSNHTAAVVPRGGGSSHQLELLHAARKAATKKRKGRSIPHVIASDQPFLKISKIAELTLQDISTGISYAIRSSQIGFDKKKFLDGVNSRAKEFVAAMDNAVASSRGQDVAPAETRELLVDEDGNALSPFVGNGDVDSLAFCAAMRVFAEWRVIRQVPEGYKGYMVGMTLGHRDVVQNLAKIETAIHDWLDDRREYLEMESERDGICQNGDLRTPTLRELLQHEIHLDIHHQRLPRLKEKSAGMGLLWVRRQLQYQTAVFANVLNVPDTYPSAFAAVSAAYSEIYGRYHGWAVQKIFNYSFQAAPDGSSIYKHMNPHRLKEVMEEAAKMRRVGVRGGSENEPGESISKKDDISPSIHDLDVDRTDLSPEASDECDNDNPLLCFFDNVGRGWNNFADGVGCEWDKLASNVVKIFDNEKVPPPQCNNDRSSGALYSRNMGSVKSVSQTSNECDKDNPLLCFFGNVGQGWNNFAEGVGCEWDKLAFNIVKIFDHGKVGSHQCRGGGASAAGGEGSSSTGGLIGEEFHEYVAKEMTMDAHRHITVYLDVMSPLLKDLNGLFDEMNMEDPTKI